jgi:hypothetical protein
VPIQVVLSSCRFDCLDCGHSWECPAPLKVILEQSVIHDGKCVMCKGSNIIGVDIEHDLLIPTREEFDAGMRPVSGPPREKP